MGCGGQGAAAHFLKIAFRVKLPPNAAIVIASASSSEHHAILDRCVACPFTYEIPRQTLILHPRPENLFAATR